MVKKGRLGKVSVLFHIQINLRNLVNLGGFDRHNEFALHI